MADTKTPETTPGKAKTPETTPVASLHKQYNLHEVKTTAVFEEQDSGGNACIGFDMRVNPEPVRTNISVEEQRVKGINGLDRAAHTRNLYHVEVGEKIPKLIERRKTEKKERRRTGKEFTDTFTY